MTEYSSKKLIKIAKYLGSAGFYQEAEQLKKLANSKKLRIYDIATEYNLDGLINIKFSFEYGDTKEEGIKLSTGEVKLTNKVWKEVKSKIEEYTEGSSFKDEKEIKDAISKADQKTMYANIKEQREEWERWYDDSHRY